MQTTAVRGAGSPGAQPRAGATEVADVRCCVTAESVGWRVCGVFQQLERPTRRCVAAASHAARRTMHPLSRRCSGVQSICRPRPSSRLRSGWLRFHPPVLCALIVVRGRRSWQPSVLRRPPSVQSWRFVANSPHVCVSHRHVAQRAQRQAKLPAAKESAPRVASPAAAPQAAPPVAAEKVDARRAAVSAVGVSPGVHEWLCRCARPLTRRSAPRRRCLRVTKVSCVLSLSRSAEGLLCCGQANCASMVH